MLKIVSVPDQILSLPTKPVEKIDENIKKLVADMEVTLIAQTDPPGVGLAANQIGINLSLFILKKGPKYPTKVFINPKIIQITNKTNKANKTNLSNKSKRKPVRLEGCLSIPRIWGPVRRANRVLLQYQNIDGKSFQKWFSGFEATIIQHEMDHLNGVVFTQRTIEQKKTLYKEIDGELKPFEV